MGNLMLWGASECHWSHGRLPDNCLKGSRKSTRPDTGRGRGRRLGGPLHHNVSGELAQPALPAPNTMCSTPVFSVMTKRTSARDLRSHPQVFAEEIISLRNVKTG